MTLPSNGSTRIERVKEPHPESRRYKDGQRESLQNDAGLPPFSSSSLCLYALVSRPPSWSRHAVAPSERVAGAPLSSPSQGSSERVPRKPPHLFDRLREIKRRLRRARSVALLLDFDGTLTALRHRPDQVALEPMVRSELTKLAHHPNVTVWIISGRNRADLRAHTRIKGVRLMGLHGWERRSRQQLLAASGKAIRQARTFIQKSLAKLPGLWLEDKGAVLVVHYRGASPPQVRQGRSMTQTLMRDLAPPLRMMPGKKIWEILPPEIKGKGEAVRELAARQPPGTLAIYAGDDTTDEQAFRALPGAITVRVGPRRATNASFRLKNPSEMHEFLKLVRTELDERR